MCDTTLGAAIALDGECGFGEGGRLVRCSRRSCGRDDEILMVVRLEREQELGREAES
jgi:hypothetical protein